MSKRITFTDRELRMLSATINAAIKSDKYHVENSLIVGKLGNEELLALLERLKIGENVLEKEVA